MKTRGSALLAHNMSGYLAKEYWTSVAEDLRSAVIAESALVLRFVLPRKPPGSTPGNAAAVNSQLYSMSCRGESENPYVISCATRAGG
jgi:hypothetical protein